MTLEDLLNKNNQLNEASLIKGKPLKKHEYKLSGKVRDDYDKYYDKVKENDYDNPVEDENTWIRNYILALEYFQADIKKAYKNLVGETGLGAYGVSEKYWPFYNEFNKFLNTVKKAHEKNNIDRLKIIINGQIRKKRWEKESNRYERAKKYTIKNKKA